MSNKAVNIANARVHFETRADRRPKQKFVKKTGDWVKVKARTRKAKVASAIDEIRSLQPELQ